jgi:hypothetical protein
MTTVKDRLQTLYNSCCEGLDGTWDCSPDGLEAMAESIEKIAELLGIDLE